MHGDTTDETVGRYQIRAMYRTAARVADMASAPYAAHLRRTT